MKHKDRKNVLNKKNVFVKEKNVPLNFLLKPTIMIVYVNDVAVKTYYGAKVKSAIWAYFRDHDIPVKTPVKEVRDAYGNRLDFDGSIRSNSKIYFKL
ncbi:MAG: hypothetical protein IKR29_04420 [Bacteroidales bacterium]|nr:hypothetical protein [Bacteroidales bacterium]